MKTDKDPLDLLHSFLEDKQTTNKVTIRNVLQRKSNNNQMDENVKKKKGNCFYYGLLGHRINDCIHKKRVEKRNGTSDRANTVQSSTHTNVIVENEKLKFF